MLLYVLLFSNGCISTKELEAIDDSNLDLVKISVPKPYMNLKRFPDEPIEFEFKILYGLRSKSNFNKVNFSYIAINTNELQTVKWGIFENGRISTISNTVFSYSIRIQDPQRINYQFYIETTDGKNDVIRYPEGSGFLFCRLFKMKKQPQGTPEGMVSIPGATIKMGLSEDEISEDEVKKKILSTSETLNQIRLSPPKRVSVAPFYLDRYEITNEHFLKFCLSTGHRRAEDWWIEKEYRDGKPTYFPKYKSKLPVSHISFSDALAYCKWKGKRLPTEAEWEFAARGARSQPYPWGNHPARNMANLYYGDDYYNGRAPVKSFARGVSPYGCFNMIGNVSEYVSDTVEIEWDDSWTQKIFILKGGSYANWEKRQDNSYEVKVYSRELYVRNPKIQNTSTGCRCAKDFTGR